MLHKSLLLSVQNFWKRKNHHGTAERLEQRDLGNLSSSTVPHMLWDLGLLPARQSRVLISDSAFQDSALVLPPPCLTCTSPSPSPSHPTHPIILGSLLPHPLHHHLSQPVRKSRWPTVQNLTECYPFPLLQSPWREQPSPPTRIISASVDRTALPRLHTQSPPPS